MKAFRIVFARVLVPALTLVLAFWTFAAPASAQGGLRDTEIERWIRQYANPLFVAAGVPPRSVDVYIINDPSINAFVTNGPSMFVHTGLLLELDRPLQVIGVLAHETGHIRAGHVLGISEAYQAATTPMLLSLLLGLGAIAAGAPDAGIAALSLGQHIGQRTVLTHIRENEGSADQAAAELLEATRQSGKGLVEVMEKFRNQEYLSGVSQDPYVRTHPLSSDRIDFLTNSVSQSPYYDKVESYEEQLAFEMIQAKIRGFLDKPQIVFRYYPQTDKSLPSHYARAVAHFRMAELDKALKDMDVLLAADPGNPYFHELKGQILFESGRVEASIPHHQQAVDLLPNAPLLRVNLGQAMLAVESDGLTRKAIENLETAIDQEPANTFAWHQLAVGYAREGDEGMANLATAERYYHSRQLGQAAQFARRAQQKLERGTPHWQQATDIMTVAAAQGVDGRGNRRR